MAGTSGRFRRQSGRFFPQKAEQARIDNDMLTYQGVFGTLVFWYFFDPADSTFDDIYDEGSVSGGKAYLTPPLRLPVLSAVPTQGPRSTDDQGFATFDRVILRVSFEQARRVGLDPDLIADRESRLLDRFVYRDRAFSVDDIQTSGHFDQASTDTMFTVAGTQLRPDELDDSPVFSGLSPWVTGTTQIAP